MPSKLMMMEWKMTEAEKVRRGAISKTNPKAAHDCPCDWCGEVIPRGRIHVKFVWGDHEKKHSKRYHPDCWYEMGKD
jgi:hypothetical protein